jgi:hypothetical protein
MPPAPLSDELLRERARQYNQMGGNAAALARSLGLSVSTVKDQISAARTKYPNLFDYEANQAQKSMLPWTLPQMLSREIIDGCVLVGGDLHIWPGEVPMMWKAFCSVAHQLRPQAIVLNGDMLDGARVSRHGSLLGSRAPKIDEEIDALYDALRMLPHAEHQLWPIGNHDMRVNNYLANAASELDVYVGRLEDRFPQWEFCYAAMLNDVEVRHRFRGGIHAAWNNALHAGISTVTGHTHQLQITAVRNRNGSHWGVEAGMLGDPRSRAFEYHEGQPSRAHEGFVVLSFDEDGSLMPPEFCEMVRGRPIFRGKPVY